MPDNPERSRRAIDFHTADQFGRMDERLKNVERKVDNIVDEVQGRVGQPGLGEQVRGIVKTWGFIIAGATAVVSWFPWIYDHFIAKTFNRPVFGEELREKWIKESTKRIRIYNKEKGQWEYFYAIEESHTSSND